MQENQGFRKDGTANRKENGLSSVMTERNDNDTERLDHCSEI